jgi:hypothetical protein
MTTTRSILIPIEITPGVQPSTDKSPFATKHYTQADKIRFRFGYPEKIGGWYSILLTGGASISGYARSLFSAIISTSINTLIGTNSYVYALSGSSLSNITPIAATTVPVANSLTTDYQLGFSNNPISTVSGSTVITFALSGIGSYYAAGDAITIAGATGFNGLAAGDINGTRSIHTVFLNSFTVIAGATANANGSGGGASVTRTTKLISVAAVAHGIPSGDRVKIAGAVDTGGILAANINGEYEVRQSFADEFGFVCGGTPTSRVTTGGGAATTYQKQIAAGAADQSLGVGYGMGKYGVGLYGTALMSASALSYPRIWFMDRYGANVIMTPGNQGGLYSWAGAANVAPALVSGAPAAINYAFVSNNIAVTFGAGNIPNRIVSSDQGNITQWTASSSNQVFDDTIEGAGTLKSHVALGNINLIFTDHQTYLFTYTGFTPGVTNSIWSVELLEPNIGIIGPMARVSVGGAAYWMDTNNFYTWSGGNVNIIPANTQEQSTIHNYVYQNINRGQSSKCFAWYNEQYDEIWFHYPSASSNEPDRVARLNRSDLTWTPDTFDRICAEYPNLTLGYPRLIDSGGVLFAHEQGNDDDGEPMEWSLTSNLRGGDATRNSIGSASTKNYMLTGLVPDSVQTGDIAVEVTGRKYPQSTALLFDEEYTISPDTEMVPVQGGARLWQYNISGSEAGQVFRAGQWQEFVQESSSQ